MAFLTYQVLFSPLTYLQGYENACLRDLLEAQGVAPTFQLSTLRRRKAWAMELPVGALQNEFRPGIVTMEAQDARCAELYAQAVTKPHRAHEGVLERDGRRYYHLESLRYLRTCVDSPEFISAAYFFLLAAVADPSLIVPPPARAPFVPFDKRPEAGRGPGWSPEEDAVLRRWFGRRTAGPDAGAHAKLTPDQWQHVLDELGGRRNKASVQNRFTILNARLAERYTIDGFMPLDRLREYMDQALGERPRHPPIRVQRKRRSRRRDEIVAGVASMS